MIDDFQISERDKEHFSKIEEWEKVNEILNMVKNGCSENEFNKFSCPFCNENIILAVHPQLKTFAIACSKTSRHFHMTESVETSPNWWSKKVTFGWLD